MKFHLRKNELSSVADVINLIERFVDDRTEGAFEWADFTEWENRNPEVESIRNEIELLTPILLSNRAGKMETYKGRLVEILQRLKSENF